MKFEIGDRVIIAGTLTHGGATGTVVTKNKLGDYGVDIIYNAQYPAHALMPRYANHPDCKIGDKFLNGNGEVEVVGYMASNPEAIYVRRQDNSVFCTCRDDLKSLPPTLKEGQEVYVKRGIEKIDYGRKQLAYTEKYNMVMHRDITSSGINENLHYLGEKEVWEFFENIYIKNDQGQIVKYEAT